MFFPPCQFFYNIEISLVHENGLLPIYFMNFFVQSDLLFPPNHCLSTSQLALMSSGENKSPPGDFSKIINHFFIIAISIFKVFSFKIFIYYTANYVELYHH